MAQDSCKASSQRPKKPVSLGFGGMFLSNSIGISFRPFRKWLLQAPHMVPIILAESLREERILSSTGSWSDSDSGVLVDGGRLLGRIRCKEFWRSFLQLKALEIFFQMFPLYLPTYLQVEKYFPSISIHETSWSLTLRTDFLCSYKNYFLASDSTLDVYFLSEFTVLVFH